jgi:Peptidase family M23
MSERMRRPWRPLLMALLGAMALAGACGADPAAFAGSAWVRPVAGAVLVGYGETYASPDGSGTRTHQGVDLACTEGERAVACEGGTVAFAGPVPGESGARVLAVTVTGDDGLRVTYMPLATAAVAAGRRVEAGSEIGGVAAQGDSSSASPHLHLSVRRGESYLDPPGMLAASAGASAGGDAGAGGGSGPGSGAGADGQAAPESSARPDASQPSDAAAAGASAARASAAAPSAASARASAGSAATAAQSGALATLTALRAAPAVSPAAAVRAVNARVSVLAPGQARAGQFVPLPHATGLAAFLGSVSSLERTATLGVAALVVGLAGLACAWKSLYRAAGTAATAAIAGTLAPATTTPQRRA